MIEEPTSQNPLQELTAFDGETTRGIVEGEDVEVSFARQHQVLPDRQ